MDRTTRAHLTGLDGLRGVAAVSVVLYHTAHVLAPNVERSAPGMVFLIHQGLNLFFVLSGFLLFLPFATRLVDGERLPSIRRYATNRILRIWPAYLVVLAVTDLVLGLAFLGHARVGRLSPREFLIDATLAHSFVPETLRTGLEVAWTLSVELSFYALLPLTAVVAFRVGRRWPIWLRAALPIAVFVGIRLAGAVWASLFPGGPHGWSHDWASVASRSLLLHADLFAWGMAATLVFVAVGRGSLPALALARLRGMAGALALGVLVAAVVVRGGPFGDTLVAIGFASLLLVVLLPTRSGSPGILGRLLERPVARALGAVSFSIYLWHMTVVRALQSWFPPAGDGWGAYLFTSAIALVVSISLAAATYRVVERPAMRWRSAIDRRRSDTGRLASTPNGVGRKEAATTR